MRRALPVALACLAAAAPLQAQHVHGAAPPDPHAHHRMPAAPVQRGSSRARPRATSAAAARHRGTRPRQPQAHDAARPALDAQRASSAAHDAHAAQSAHDALGAHTAMHAAHATHAEHAEQATSPPTPRTSHRGDPTHGAMPPLAPHHSPVVSPGEHAAHSANTSRSNASPSLLNPAQDEVPQHAHDSAPRVSNTPHHDAHQHAAEDTGHEHAAAPAVDDPSHAQHDAAHHHGHVPEEHSPTRQRDVPRDAAPRTPVPVPSDADRAAAFAPLHAGHAAHDQRTYAFFLVDRLEQGSAGAGAFETRAWWGGDVQRAWLRSEGELERGRLEHGRVELLYGRSVTPWWDVVAGVRQDVGHGPDRRWLALGVQGLAPYKIEVQATAYLAGGGRSTATVEGEYDTLLGPRLVLQWRGEATFEGQRDPARGVGAGLSSVVAGARLRYELRRRFAPYVGVELERAFGETATLRHADGARARDVRAVAGLRFWF